MIAQLKSLLESTGLPVAYSHFKAPPPLPYICFYRSQGETGGSDYGNEIRDEVYVIELYSQSKDIASEEKIELLLNQWGAHFSINESYIDSEEMYLCSFTVEVYYKKEWLKNA